MADGLALWWRVGRTTSRPICIASRTGTLGSASLSITHFVGFGWPALEDGRVQKSNLVASGHYALRPRGSNRNDPLVQVTFLGKARGGKVKVRFEGGESAGLEEWVATRSLACEWGERKEMLRDDEAAVRLIEIDSAAWDRVRQEAIFLVFEASGEETGFGRTWTTTQAQAVRL